MLKSRQALIQQEQGKSQELAFLTSVEVMPILPILLARSHTWGCKVEGPFPYWALPQSSSSGLLGNKSLADGVRMACSALGCGATVAEVEFPPPASHILLE